MKRVANLLTERQGKMKRLFLVSALVLVALGLSLIFGAAEIDAFDNDACLGCHNDPGLTKITQQEGKTSLYVDKTAFASSAHGDFECASCHGLPSLLLHTPENITPLTPQSLNESCSTCHEQQSLVYLDSAHSVSLAGGSTGAADCADCHSPSGNAHSIISVLQPDSPVHENNIDQTCATCHDDDGLMAKYDISAMVYENYISSAHGQTQQLDIDQVATTCTSCHGSHDITSVNGFNTSLAEKCGSCHQLQSTQYLGSIHGTNLALGSTDAATCLSCHNAGEDTHNIVSVSAPDSPVYRTSIAETCATCHDDEVLMAKYDISDTVYDTYKSFFHGKATTLATFEQVAQKNYATCTSCHGSHDILAADDPSSPVATLAALTETCATCHDGATTNFAAGYHMHEVASTETQVPTFIANVAYGYLLIPALVILGTSFVVLDFLRSFKMFRKNGK